LPPPLFGAGSACFSKNARSVSAPNFPSATNNLIIEYDENNKAFTLKRGVSVSSFCKYNETVLFSTINNYIYKYADGLSWDGSAIQTIWETGTTDLGVPDSKKSISTIYVTGTSSPLEEGYAGDIKLTVVTEKDATSKYKIFSLGTTNNIKKIKCKNKGRIVGFKIENVGGSSFNIKSIKPIIEVDVD
jgi:hypothetical protein